MGTEDKEGSMMDWLSNKPVDWKLFRLEEMYYEVWEDLYLSEIKEA